MKRLARHRTVLIAGAGVLLVALIGWFAAVSPQRAKGKSLSRQIQDTQAKLTEARLAARPTSSHPVVRAADVYRLAKAMPDAVDMPGVVLELSTVAGRAGVTLEAVAPQAEQQGASYRYVPISLRFQGSYYDLSEFFYRVRNLVNVHRGRLWATGRLFTVDGFDFVEGKEKFPFLQATLSVNAYVYDPAAGLPTESTGTDTTSTGTTPATTTASNPPPVQATAAGVRP